MRTLRAVAIVAPINTVITRVTRLVHTTWIAINYSRAWRSHSIFFGLLP